MYELKGKTRYYIIIVCMWYMMVVLLCTTGDKLLYSIGLFMGMMPYVVMGMILFMYCIEKIMEAYSNEEA